MRITAIGHCTILIETNGKKIVTDPYFDLKGDSAYERLRPPARTREELLDVNLVLISHNHWDHIDLEYLRLLANSVPVVVPNRMSWPRHSRSGNKIIKIATWENRRFGRITITAVPASHITVAVGFVIQSEEKQVYFAGDTYYHPFMNKIRREFQLDVALIPITAYRIPMTMGEKGALRAVRSLAPRTVIPIHLAIRPRSPLLRAKHSPEEFQRHVRDAGLECRVIMLREGQSYEI